MLATKIRILFVAVLSTWLSAWIVLSWGAAQDDSFIHSRYAGNLSIHHFLTYDGIHQSYGSSSLLYVGLLALLRSVNASPNLARTASSVVHVLLFAGLAAGFGRYLGSTSRVAKLAGLLLLGLVATPSAVRWLDDGMETALVVATVSLLAWMIHEESARAKGALWRYAALSVLAFAAVLLRTELLLVCAVGFVILLVGRLGEEDLPWRGLAAAVRECSHLLLGGALAAAFIMATMHALLPDTAIAKSHGISLWFNPVHDTAVTLGGAFSFGAGVGLFWVVTLALVVLGQQKLIATTALANAFCPLVLLASALRGQEIQGVRYFAWTFFFSIVWNILEIARIEQVGPEARWQRSGELVLWVFAGLVMLQLPIETVAMRRVLMGRAETVRRFESQHLEVLKRRQGIASDIGYIGYFSGAAICDLAGLVNGRPSARMSSLERAHACLRSEPDFVFANVSQLGPLARMADLSAWQVCGRYDFVNVRTPDTHFLVVRPGIANEVCGATGSAAQAIGMVLPEMRYASLRQIVSPDRRQRAALGPQR